MFRDFQTEFGKKADCNIRAVYEKGDSAWIKMKEEILAYEKTCKNIKRKHTYIKSSHDVRHSDESHNLFRGLCAHFYNVTQEFVNGNDEADMLHAALNNARAKLVDYRAKLWNKTVTDAHTSIATDTSSVAGTEDIQGPSKVTIKGRPKGKRLRYELKKSIKKSMQRKRKSSGQDNRVESCGNIDLDAPAQ
ncbi:protein FAR-RED IMPAIRED RESPONSE 1-like [Arachis hypogaea]|nr:protein FAR-RED IMPAIRED RESPONSE 1-like [Arachis hypogaea]